MSNVGYATLSIIPSAKGFGPALSGLVDAPVAQSSAKTSKSFGNAFTGALGGIVKVGAGAIGVVGGLVAGLSIKGGIARQLQIENAQAKLSGLGHSTAAVTQIMDNALASVKGTAFGMGEAASVAASAVAAGVKPGKDLERTLKLTGDAATIAGLDMSSMGAIFNKVAANNKLSGEEVLQLQKQGFPILKMVADQYGVTQAAASKMVSEGKVDFATFQNAIEASVGGAALKSGDTTVGAFANMKAAFSRFGVVLTSWFMPLLKNVFTAIGDAVDALTAILKPWAETFGAIFQAKAAPAIAEFGTKAIAFFGRIGEAAGSLGSSPAFASITSSFSNIGAALGPVIGGLVGLMAPLLKHIPLLGQAFTGLTGPIGLVIGLIASLFAASPALREAIGSAFGSLMKIVGDLAATLGPAIGGILGAFTPLMALLGDTLAPIITQVMSTISGVIATSMPTIVALVSAVASVFAALVPVVASVLAAVLPLVNTLIAQLGPILSDLITAILPALVPLISTVGAYFATLAPIIGQVLTAIMPLVSVLLSELAPIITELISTVLPPVVALFGEILTAVLPLIATLADLLIPVIQMLMPIVVTVFGVVGDVIKGLMPVVTTIFGIITSVIRSAMTIIQGIIEVVTGLISGNWGKVWSGLGKILSGAWDLIVSVLKGALDLVVGLFANIIPTLFNAGKNIVEGLINGIKAVAGKIGEALLKPIKGAIEGVKNFLGIHSPSRLMMSIGAFTTEGMARGLESGAERVADASAALIPALPDSFTSPEVDGGGIAGVLAAAANRGGGDQWSIEYNDHSTSHEDKQSKLLKAQTIMEQTVAARRG